MGFQALGAPAAQVSGDPRPHRMNGPIKDRGEIRPSRPRLQPVTISYSCQSSQIPQPFPHAMPTTTELSQLICILCCLTSLIRDRYFDKGTSYGSGKWV